jgi:oleate hydratase
VNGLDREMASGNGSTESFEPYQLRRGLRLDLRGPRKPEVDNLHIDSHAASAPVVLPVWHCGREKPCMAASYEEIIGAIDDFQLTCINGITVPRNQRGRLHERERARGTPRPAGPACAIFRGPSPHDRYDLSHA